MADIFISYSRKDRDSAERIAGALQGFGWTVWWDRQIHAGESFDRRIELELEAAGCVIVVWSAASVESEWVKNEAAAAMERDALVPVLIEDVRVPMEFRRRQAVDLGQWQGATEDADFDALRRSIEAKLRSPPPNLRPIARPVTRPASKRWNLRLLGSAAVVALLASATYFWVARYPRSESVEARELTPADAPMTTATEPTPQTYSMKCAAGGPFGIRREADIVRIQFVPAASAATQDMIPGQCSWTDRPLNSDEPHELCDSGSLASKLVSDLEKSGLVSLQVAYEQKTHCLRIYRL